MNRAKRYIKRTIHRWRGWKTNRKIVVIESDDWGSIRMPSKKTYNKFLNLGVRVDKDDYCKYDNLATPNELSSLYDVLSSVKDKNGNNAILTANVLMANPDFDKIRASNFEEYHFEKFTDTLKRFPSTENSFDMWIEGMAHKLFYPQSHGREHVYVKKWMNDLKAGVQDTRIAFDLGTFGLTSETSPDINLNYMGAFNSGLEDDINVFNSIIEESLDMFEETFNYKSLSFIPTTYTYPREIEPTLANNGVRFLQGTHYQTIPMDDDTTFKSRNNSLMGRKSSSGLIYLIRTCNFEPSQPKYTDSINICLQKIEKAFNWRMPAIISTHRLNFIGSIHQKNRDNNLKSFKTLLTEIVKRWPDVEFMTSDQLGILKEQG